MQKRGKYVRVRAEVDISKPLLAMFTIKESVYKVEYEGLRLICINYGRFVCYKYGCSYKQPQKEVDTVRKLGNNQRN